MEEKNQSWTETSAKLFCLCIFALCLFIIFKYARAVVLLAVISFAVASGVNALAKKLQRVIKLPRSFVALALLLLLFIFCLLLISLFAVRLIEEAEKLLMWISVNRESLSVGFENFISKTEALFARAIPVIENNRLSEYLNESAGNILDSILSLLGKKILTILTSLISATPSAAIWGLLFLLSCFYFTVDYEKILSSAEKLMPKSLAPHKKRIKEGLSRTVGNYARAYLLIFFITFFEIFIGLTILKRPYALLISLGIAILDIMPVFGAGAALVPWAVFSLITGQRHLGAGLLALYGIVTIVRQLAEPHIIGKNVGIHPLISLLCVALGIKFFGIFGALIAPLAAVLIKEVINFTQTEK